MDEIVKHINDTNASFRTPNAGDAKNTDLFLDNEHYELFKEAGEQVIVRFSKENLSKAILFIASILPRKYDNSAIHKSVSYSPEFVYDQLAFLDYYFKEEGVSVARKTQTWNAHKDVPKKNGEIDNRFYFNGLLEEVEYVNSKGEHVSSKFTIRNYLAGGYSNLHIKKAEDGIFDVWVTNAQEAFFYNKEDGLEELDKNSPQNLTLQQIFYGAPGTGKSHGIKEKEGDFSKVIRTTFHPDSDYSTFVGAYKPTMKRTKKCVIIDKEEREINPTVTKDEYEERISYTFVKQAFLKAYIEAWSRYDKGEKVLLVIEEINRGNCAQIFGDLFQLLDRNGEGYSDYPIQADEDLRKVLADEFANIDNIPENVKSGEELLLPNNLYIWATMNTSDQSLFPIDSAFKRRWDWKCVPIDTAKESWVIKVNGKEYSWTSFLNTINENIYAKTQSEDKQLGFYFCKAEGDVISAEKFVGKVLFYIYNDVYKDYGFDEDFFVDKSDNKKLTFRSFYNFDGSINEGKVEAILKNLEIKKTDDDSDGNDKVGMSVQYNGQTVHEKNDLETYVKILELIGVDRIATLDIKCYDQNIVGVEPPGNYAWRTVNNYKVLTFKLHRHMERILNEIAAKLQIDLHVSFE